MSSPAVNNYSLYQWASCVQLLITILCNFVSEAMLSPAVNNYSLYQWLSSCLQLYFFLSLTIFSPTVHGKSSNRRPCLVQFIKWLFLYQWPSCVQALSTFPISVDIPELNCLQTWSPGGHICYALFKFSFTTICRKNKALEFKMTDSECFLMCRLCRVILYSWSPTCSFSCSST